METTPKAAKMLSNCLMMHNWTQSDLAKAASIAIPTVSHHITGNRPIRDDHLAAYLPCLDAPEQRDLLAAWLQDVLPQSVQERVLEPTSNRLNEAVTTFTLGLTIEQQSMLRFWAQKLAADDELDHIFAAITRKAGWRP
jgi:transcriptional regulator with XRE-family HTH domain